ncbi:MAG: right-handed parallel beta-helix repeat-containing protein, partial [Polyangiales bacterium]
AGSDTNDGSSAKPWKSLQAVIDGNKIASQGWDKTPYTTASKLVAKNAGAPVKAGDTIWLRSGDHGALSITGYYNTGNVTIAAEKGQTPKLSRVQIRSCASWIIAGLDVRAEYAPTYSNATLFTIEPNGFSGPTHDIVAQDCTLKSKADVAAWTKTDWDTLAADGFSVGGDAITIRNNRLQHVDFGISVGATKSLIEGNVVDSFSGDGMRGLGDGTVFQYNTVKNSRQVNDNHCDGFQSWSVGADGKVGTGTVKGIVLRGNRFYNYDDPSLAFVSSMQGIGLFDGMYEDWVIENNVVITDHWHGISLYGAKNCRVVNNTVIDPNTVSPGPPWIKIENHKDGTAPTGNVVRNNLTMDLALTATGVAEDHDLKIKTTDFAALFVDAAKYDLHLLPTATAARDKGSSDLAPAIDLDGIARPQGAAVDLGAFEWHEPGVVPADAGAIDSAVADGATLDGAVPDGATGGDAATGADASPGDGGEIAPSEGASGCGCRVARPSTHHVWTLAALVVLALHRRRTRRDERARSARGMRCAQPS